MDAEFQIKNQQYFNINASRAKLGADLRKKFFVVFLELDMKGASFFTWNSATWPFWCQPRGRDKCCLY